MPTELSVLLKKMLAERGLKQLAIADATGVSRAAVSTWMRGEKVPAKAHLPQLSLLLGIELEKLESLTAGTPRPKQVPIPLDARVTTEDFDWLAKMATELGGKLPLRLALELLAQKKVGDA